MTTANIVPAMPETWNVNKQKNVNVPISFARSTSPENAIWYMGHLMTILAGGEETGGGFALIEVIGRKGHEPPRHIHAREDEIFYVMEGEGTFYVGDDVIRATPGTLVFMPKGVPHHFTLETEQVKALLLITPAGFENFFREFSVPAPALTLPPPSTPSYEDIKRVIAVGAKYGIAFVPPQS